jgi:hypothetical protein
VTKPTPTSWPRNTVQTIETRKRDLVIRIADWTRQSVRTGEPAYDVEVYIRGVYEGMEGGVFPVRRMSKAEARRQAVECACQQIRKHLR